MSDLLADLDAAMTIENPFDVTGGQTIGGLGITDPFSWLEESGSILWNDWIAFTLRSLFFAVGVFILLRVINEYIDYGALIQAVSTIATSA